MAKNKRNRKAIQHSRRFYTFKSDQFIKDNIEEVRGNIKLKTLELKYAYILHKAIVSKTFNKEYDKKGFTLRKKANSEALQRDPSQKYNTLSWLFGGNDKSIKEIVDNLISWKVIKPHQKHKVGERATSYKLTPQWEVEPITMRTFYGRKGSLVYKLNNRWNVRLKHPIVAATQTIYDHHVSLNVHGIRLIQQKYPDPRVYAIAEALLGGYFDENKEALQDSLLGLAIDPEDVVLMSFFTKDLYCNPVGRGKRLYHSITNLKREYRKFVLLDGKPICEVDISCSQPTFAAAFLVLLHRKTFPSDSLPNDLLLMMDLCRKGIFYEQLAKEAGIILTEENRGKFKEDFFEQVFYAKVTESVRKIKTAFKNLFPIVYQMIVGIKGENYKQFPQLMQDLEAELMVYHVYATLLEEGHIVLVLHDAILCATDIAVQRSKEIIREAFRSWFGQEISFKVEPKSL